MAGQQNPPVNLEQQLLRHNLPYPVTRDDAISVIGALLTKLDIDAGVLASVFARCNIQRFQARVLYRYIPATAVRNTRTYKAAYVRFYNDNSAGAVESAAVRAMFPFGADVFATCCTDLLFQTSSLIHSISNIYLLTRGVAELRRLVLNLPQLTENQRLALTAITELPVMRVDLGP